MRFSWTRNLDVNEHEIEFLWKHLYSLVSRDQNVSIDFPLEKSYGISMNYWQLTACKPIFGNWPSFHFPLPHLLIRSDSHWRSIGACAIWFEFFVIFENVHMPFRCENNKTRKYVVACCLVQRFHFLSVLNGWCRSNWSHGKRQKVFVCSH